MSEKIISSESNDNETVLPGVIEVLCRPNTSLWHAANLAERHSLRLAGKSMGYSSDFPPAVTRLRLEVPIGEERTWASTIRKEQVVREAYPIVRIRVSGAPFGC